MFERRGDDVVAGAEQTVEGEIQTVGGVEGENDSLWGFGPEQFGSASAAAIDEGLYFETRAISAATDGGSELPLVVIDGRIDGFGLGEAGGGVVEVDG